MLLNINQLVDAQNVPPFLLPCPSYCFKDLCILFRHSHTRKIKMFAKHETRTLVSGVTRL
jgi:hypothetical protein